MKRPEGKTIWIWQLYVASEHRYKAAGTLDVNLGPMQEMDVVECVAGRGLVGDRYFDHEKDYPAQVTFFCWDLFSDVCEALQIENRDPAQLRRNVIIEGQNLNELVGKQFEIGGVRFEGTRIGAPCSWFDDVLTPGAAERMKGNGGLRAKVLNSGWLKKGENRLISG